MDATDALDRLLQVSTQVREAVICREGAIVARGGLDPGRAEELAVAGRRLLDRAGALRGPGSAQVVDVRVALPEADVYAQRGGALEAVAVTAPGSTRSLVAYDLRVALDRARGEDA